MKGILSLSSEIGWNLAPFLRFPFYNRYVDGVGAEPVFGSGVDDGEKLADVVGAVDRTIMEDLGTGLKVDALVFHRTGIAGTGGIHSPGVGYYLVG